MMIDIQLTPVPASIYCVLSMEGGLDIRLDVSPTDNVVVVAGAEHGVVDFENINQEFLITLDEAQADFNEA